MTTRAITPFANELLKEKDLTTGPWLCRQHLTKALTEILYWAQYDRDDAVRKASQLYGMARTEFKEHFEIAFKPDVQVVKPKHLTGRHLPRLCHSIHKILQELGLV